MSTNVILLFETINRPMAQGKPFWLIQAPGVGKTQLDDLYAQLDDSMNSGAPVVVNYEVKYTLMGRDKAQIDIYYLKDVPDEVFYRLKMAHCVPRLDEKGVPKGGIFAWVENLAAQNAPVDHLSDSSLESLVGKYLDGVLIFSPIFEHQNE